jgi:hypothetical protein
MYNPHTTIPEGHPENENLMYVISEDEVLAAIRQSSTKKSPGADGLSWEFYLKVWGIMHREVTFIMNEIQTGNFDKSQKEKLRKQYQGLSTDIFFELRLQMIFEKHQDPIRKIIASDCQ